MDCQRSQLAIVVLAAACLVSSAVSCSKDNPSSRRDAGNGLADAGEALDAGSKSESDAAADEDLIVAPDGEDSARGTLQQPTTLAAALMRIAPGRTVYMRGGIYRYSDQITIARENRGSSSATKTLSQYQREAPILDFFEQAYGSEDNPHGLRIEGNYWHVVGLIVRGAAGAGLYVAGSHDRIERCASYGNRATGIQLGASTDSSDPLDWPSDNLILNCESFDNYDRPPGAGERADGFGLNLGVGPGNVFRGCVAHHNIGDGWDLSAQTELGSSAAVTIDQCVAHTNGSLSDGTHSASGECSGFRLGSTGMPAAHSVTRSIAYNNDRNGFTSNGNPAAIRLTNTLAFENARGNYAFGDAMTGTPAVFTNNVSVWVETAVAIDDTVSGEDAGGSNRFWAGGSGVTASDFASALSRVMVLRGDEGVLDLSDFELASDSRLIDAGILPEGSLPFDRAYYQGEPDLGAVETR